MLLVKCCCFNILVTVKIVLVIGGVMICFLLLILEMEMYWGWKYVEKNSCSVLQDNFFWGGDIFKYLKLNCFVLFFGLLLPVILIKTIFDSNGEMKHYVIKQMNYFFNSQF